MLSDIVLAIIQAATEFLPISSTGHLALFSNLLSRPNLFFFTALHMASLIAVIIFTRDEIAHLFSNDKKYENLWLCLIIASIPAILFGLLFKNIIEKTLSSFLFLGIAFIFNGLFLLLTRFSKTYSKLNVKNSLIIGLSQALGLFPGISRSGITISAALFSGIERERAIKFSFLLFIPLGLGAFVLKAGEFYFNLSLVISFFVCLVLSLLFLKLLFFILKKGEFWKFSIYCIVIGLVALLFYFRKG